MFVCAWGAGDELSAIDTTTQQAMAAHTSRPDDPLLISYAELEDIRSSLFSDDINIDLDRMQHWTTAEAHKFFDSGGVISPPPRPLRNVRSVLADAGLERLLVQLEGERLADWVVRLRHTRHDLLRRLKVCGVVLSERQAIVNSLAKAWRESRVLAEEFACAGTSTLALPTPIELWHEAVAAVAELRQLTPAQLEERLPNSDLRAPLCAFLTEADTATLTAAQIVRRWSADALGDTLEGLGWSLDKVRLLLDGCGLSDGTARPRLGQDIALWTNQMGERGTEVALYDYADFAERCLGLTSWIVHPPRGFEGVLSKFQR